MSIEIEIDSHFSDHNLYEKCFQFYTLECSFDIVRIAKKSEVRVSELRKVVMDSFLISHWFLKVSSVNFFIDVAICICCTSRISPIRKIVDAWVLVDTHLLKLQFPRT